ncbi:uncharacterized protein DUF4249 [Mariniflexile fucanivorans]|uniref:Uncharacterized protein DUF4249 n=1 Tax=Mariniflexile fucanivorans TaxID=264023 RepID=A0A4R1RQ52_9FLAO|nr:DUF4249 domain-containing protein [Mariniflexile fucanivorans]TCL68060.1 uncharacterized protein DUF4249 [Mariniflexile fucanivorans]
MKKIIYIICCLILVSCEDVIDLELKTAEPRLVIDASLIWYKNTTGNNQFIKLTLTAPYYDVHIPVATGATVTVTDSNNNTFNFIEENDTGIYRNQSFIPTINSTYNLKIIYMNEVYTASETLIPIVDIDKVEQKNDAGFSGEETEIKAFYTDPENIKNYYFFEFFNSDSNTITLDVYDDKFTDGNQIFAFYSNEDIETGTKLIIQNHGISQRFYEYINILLQQSKDETGDPFETQPATLRGNCVNETNPDNYPLGYFRASEVSIFNYEVE